MQEEGKGKNGRGRWTPGAGLGSAIGALAVVALVALVPVSQATAATPQLLLPAKDFGTTYSTGTQYGACGTAKIVKAPHFSDRSRLFKGSVASSAPACKPSASSNVGIADEELLLTTTSLPFKHNGSYVLNFTWNFTVAETWDLVPYSTCALNFADPQSSCFVYVEDTVYTQPIIFDESNYSWGPYSAGVAFATALDFYTFSFGYVQNSTYGNSSYGVTGAGSFSGTLNGTNTFNLTGTSSIVSTNTYEVEVIVLIQTIAEAYSYDAKATGKASASATINCATLGNHGFLRAISLT